MADEAQAVMGCSLATLFQLVTDNGWQTTLIVVGACLILLSALAASTIAKGGEFTSGSRIIFFSALSLGAVMLAAGSLAAWAQSIGVHIRRISPDQSFANLETNSRAEWLIRLIPHDPEKSELSIARLPTLGLESQEYTFVASYHELRGYRVSDAVRMVGGTLRPNQSVSAIIFKVEAELFPANALGLMEVINLLQTKHGVKLEKSFPLTDTQRATLKTTEGVGLEHWAYKNYDYRQMCEMAQKFRCDEPAYSEKTLIGSIAKDWHPLGFANLGGGGLDPCGTDRKELCSVYSWREAKDKYKGKFGSRAFLFPNMKIDELSDRLLIEFHDPQNEYIPDIGQELAEQ